jgi:hypothetical protein
MSNPSDAVRNFCRDHQLRVVDTNKRAYKHSKANINFFKFEDDYNKFFAEPIHFETETLYTVEISESELQRIAEFEEQVFNNMKSQGHYNIFETLMAQKQQEKYLRESYPAVKKAYEHYSLMLKLAQSGEL